MQKENLLKKYLVVARNRKTLKKEELILFAKNVKELKKKAKLLDLSIISYKEVKKKIKLSKKEMEYFFSLISDAMSTGVNLLSALSVIKTDSKNLKTLVNEIILSLKAGESFANALFKFRETFPHFILVMIKAGELSGSLSQTLKEAYKFINDMEEKQSKLKKELIPPLIKLSIIFLTFFSFSTFVLPRLLNNSFIANYVSPTIKLLCKITSIVIPTFTIFFIFTFIFLTLLKRQNIYLYEKLISKIPFVNKIYEKQEVFLTYYVMYKLLENNVSFVQAIEVAKKSTNSPFIKNSLDKVLKYLKEGKDYYNYFPSIDEGYKLIIKNATTSKAIVNAFKVISRRAFEEYLDAVSFVPKLANILFFLVAFYIIFLLINLVLLPYFKMYQQWR